MCDISLTVKLTAGSVEPDGIAGVAAQADSPVGKV